VFFGVAPVISRGLRWKTPTPTPAREIPAWRNVRAAVIVEAEQMPIPLQPMPLRRRSLPFDDPDWIYELKMDAFRALAVIEHGRAQLLSRNGRIRSLRFLRWQNQSPIPCRM